MIFKDDYFADGVKTAINNITLCEDTFLNSTTIDRMEVSDAIDLNKSHIEKTITSVENESFVDNSIILFNGNSDIPYLDDELSDSENNSMISHSSSDFNNSQIHSAKDKPLRTDVKEQVGTPIPSEGAHTKLPKCNTSYLEGEKVTKVIDLNCNNTLEAIMNEPSDVITEPSAPADVIIPINSQDGKPFIEKCDDVIQPVKLKEVEDTPSLYKYVNAIYTDMEKYKNECKTLRNQVFNLTNRINDISKQFLDFKSTIGGRVLGNEISIETSKNKKDAKVDGLSKRVDRNSTKIGNLPNFENVKNRLEQDIALANQNIESNIKELKNIADEVKRISQNNISQNNISQNNNTEDSHRGITESYQYDQYEQYDEYDQYQPASATTTIQNVQPNDNTVFNHDVIFIVDSNLKRMIPEKMDHNSTCERFYCPTLFHIKELLQKADIQKNPKKIFIHCGTNHIYSGSKSTSKLENEYMCMIEKLHAMFPSTKIFISSLLPRGDSYVKNSVQYFNDFLCGVCSGDPLLYFLRNNNISRHRLVDYKHVDDDGFITLLSNIRFILFGKVPHFKRENTYFKYTE